MSVVREFFTSNQLPTLLTVGVLTLIGFYLGKTMRFIRMPSILGFMIVGVVLGPGLLGFLTESTHAALGFVTEIAIH